MAEVTLTTFDPSSEPDAALYAAWTRMKAQVYLEPRPDDEAIDRLRARAFPARLVAALDGDAVVGSYRSWETRVTAPGGAAVPADAVSSVAVLPTHRRRGILTRMITEDLALASDRGLPLAVLIAAEAPIYGRYGFGAATETARWVVDLRAARLAPGVPDGGSVRVADEVELRAVAPAVQEAARRPGELDHPDAWWDRSFGVHAEPGRVPRGGLLHLDGAGRPDGFATWRAEESWTGRVSASVVHVEQFRAASAEAYAGLWSVLTSMDIVARLEAPELAVDEALPWLLADARAARQFDRSDFQWSRLLDPAAALSARTYETPGAVTLEVTDPAGWAAGTYVLEADATGAGACSRTSRPAEVTLPVDVLSSLWLGGGDLHGAVVAGRVGEHAPGAAARLARLLSTTRAPWTPTWF